MTERRKYVIDVLFVGCECKVFMAQWMNELPYHIYLPILFFHFTWQLVGYVSKKQILTPPQSVTM